MQKEAVQCPHLEQLLASESQDDASAIVKRFRDVVAWSVSYDRNSSNMAKRRKLSNRPACDTCRAPLARPVACLHCPFSGCWHQGHVRTHLKRTGHRFCVDPSTGSLYCFACDDFVYNSMAEMMFMENSSDEDGTPSKRARLWVPSTRDEDAMLTSPSVMCESRRGLLNLGQTCFMNAVLQSFVHNPFLRNYFLGDKHDKRICLKDACTSCEMDNLFTEIYSEDSLPYGPIGFLVTTWRGSSELAGYAQQDAHEFFISTLNQIHSSSPEASNSAKCRCIVHTTFAGQLQSDVQCGLCGNVTLTVDPMFDISLELRAAGDNTLFDCLRRFTRPERLGTKEYSCEKCGKNAQEASKRMSIRRLPPVLSFQFKRFEQNIADKGAVRKIEASVRFPATLDMTSFTTRAMQQSLSDDNASPPSRLADLPGTYVYDLFAVINHEGQMNNGHYTNFARFGREWYRFDDDKVTHTNLANVLSSAAYMCFYVKRRLDYQDGDRPETAIVSQPTAVDANLSYQTEEQEDEEEEEVEEYEAARMREVEAELLGTL